MVSGDNHNQADPLNLDAMIARETQPWRIIRSEHGWGWHLWLGRFARINSRKSLTPMRPHIYRSGDEHCNPVLAFHLWPLGGLDVWWRGQKRTEADGPCDDCIRDMADIP